MILSAQRIRRLCDNSDFSFAKPLVEPYQERSVFNGMSFGLGAAGYDFRIHVEGANKGIHLRPGDFELAVTKEKFHFPPDLLGVVHDKSSWARRGLAIQNTVLEPGWFGFITLELSNHGRDILWIPDGAPIGQVVFHMLTEATEAPYGGKYQDQPQIPVRSLLEDDDDPRKKEG